LPGTKRKYSAPTGREYLRIMNDEL